MKFKEFLHEGRYWSDHSNWIVDNYDENFDVKFEKDDEDVFQYVAPIAGARKQLIGLNGEKIDWLDRSAQSIMIDFKGRKYIITKEQTKHYDEDMTWRINIVKHEEETDEED